MSVTADAWDGDCGVSSEKAWIIRLFISLAALLVKVNSRIFEGLTPLLIKDIVRSVKTRVFPYNNFVKCLKGKVVPWVLRGKKKEFKRSRKKEFPIEEYSLILFNG